MKTRTARPMLRAASLTFGSMLAACGSAQGGPDPIPPPGNPKGSMYDDAATLKPEAPALLELELSLARGDKPESPTTPVTVLLTSIDNLTVYVRRELTLAEALRPLRITEADRIQGSPALPEIVKVQASFAGVPTSPTEQVTYFTSGPVTVGGRAPLVFERRVVEFTPALPMTGNPKGSRYDDGPLVPVK